MPSLRKLHKLLDPEIRAKNLQALQWALRGRWYDLARPAMPDPVFLVGCSRSGTTATTQANWLTMQQVQTKLEAAGYRDFEKIERERDKYEVKAIDPQGQRVELDIDPVTGDVLKTEVKRSK